MKRWCAGFLALGGACLLASCASGPLIPPGTAVEVQSDRAPFYKYGPAQTFGADDMLTLGTRLTLIQRSMGFSRVMLASGVTGYISNDDIAPIPPSPVTTTAATSGTKPKAGSSSRGGGSQQMYSGPVRRSAVKPTPGDPLFDISDTPLPVLDEPHGRHPEPVAGTAETHPPGPESHPSAPAGEGEAKPAASTPKPEATAAATPAAKPAKKSAKSTTTKKKKSP